jgi:hypothetical protein
LVLVAFALLQTMQRQEAALKNKRECVDEVMNDEEVLAALRPSYIQDVIQIVLVRVVDPELHSSTSNEGDAPLNLDLEVWYPHCFWCYRLTQA